MSKMWQKNKKRVPQKQDLNSLNETETHIIFNRKIHFSRQVKFSKFCIECNLTYYFILNDFLSSHMTSVSSKAAVNFSWYNWYILNTSGSQTFSSCYLIDSYDISSTHYYIK